MRAVAVIQLLLTFHFEVHASKHQRTDELRLHLPFKVDEYSGQVAVGVVWDASGGDGLEELCLGKFSGQHVQVLIDEGAEGDAGGEKKIKVDVEHNQTNNGIFF